MALGIRLFAIDSGYAQSRSNDKIFKLINATRQQWSGGVAGRYGINYYIEIQTKLKGISIDTVWISGVPYPTDFSANNPHFKYKFDSASRKITYSISVEETHNDMRFRHNGISDSPKDTMKNKVPAVRHFTGAALISYALKNKKHFYTISSFTSLAPISYP